MVDPIQDARLLVDEFSAVATSDPVSGALFAIGALVIVFSSVYFGYLVFGAALSLLSRDLANVLAGNP